MEKHGLAIASFIVWVEADKGQKLQVESELDSFTVLMVSFGSFEAFGDPLIPCWTSLIEILVRDLCQGSIKDMMLLF